eukprot:TRINITY_DN4037_c0_g1_i1.p1 TRINITY_DN4037_c0_g1~~TRINITY_DN4037_c0_g1_i1.p1  ORF type:complete len:277 (+),score=76.88 TRINITY_DN4037_c0_g1_i1:104-934(+)
MKELLMGIIDFRRRLRPSLLPSFQKMATVQHPNSLFVACADSRVVPDLFASTHPGELFTIRNVGNMVVPPSVDSESKNDESELAALEFSIDVLGVKNIIICGHSECGAMKAALQSQQSPEFAKEIATKSPHLSTWLQQSQTSLTKYNKYHKELQEFYNGNATVAAYIDSSLPPHDQLSQINTLQQVENVCKWKKVADKIQRSEIMVHAWWFDIMNADVYSFSERKQKFVLIDDSKAEEILKRLGETESLSEIAKRYGPHLRDPNWVGQYIQSSKQK